jgi:hypothetical protein
VTDGDDLAGGPRPPGFAGRLARAFIESKLTPLLVIFALGLGALAVLMTPREEEPQIKVPMFDVFVAAPGRSVVEVERQVIAPLERELWSVPGVEYVYSTSSPDGGLVIVRFRVGVDPDSAVVRVRSKVDSLLDRWPRDLAPPLVKPRSIDDVPIWALTLSSRTQDPATLRQLAAEIENEIKAIPEVSDTALIEVSGGSSASSSTRRDWRRGGSPPRRCPRRSSRRTAGSRRARSFRTTVKSQWRPAASSAPARSSVPSSSPSRPEPPSTSPKSRESKTARSGRRCT